MLPSQNEHSPSGRWPLPVRSVTGVLASAIGGFAASLVFLPRAPATPAGALEWLAGATFLLTAAVLWWISGRNRSAIGTTPGLRVTTMAAGSDVENWLTSMPAMAYSTDDQGRLIAVSDMWLRKLGYCRDEVLGRHATEFLSERSRTHAVRDVLPDLLRTGFVENVELQLVHKDGRAIDIVLAAVFAQRGAGRKPCPITVSMDVTARKEAERALAASEARYRVLIEDQSEMVSLSTVDGTLEFVNEAYARQFGRTAQGMIGTSLYDYVPATELETVRARLASLWQHGGVALGENRMVFANGGGERVVAWVNRALRDADGHITGLHAVGRDITEQKTLENQMVAAAREIEDLYDHAPCGYHSVGAAGKYLKVNATELNWLGCPRAEVVGKLGPADFVSRQDADLVLGALHRAQATGMPETLEYRLLGRHGVTRDASLTMSVVLDEDGSFLMTRAVTFDVTDRVNAERAVRRLNQEQHAILQSDLLGIARLRERRFCWVNHGFARILGYLPEQLAGASTRSLFPSDESYQAFGAAAYAVLAAGGTYHSETCMARKDGVQIWVEMTGVMFDPAIGESLWLFADITRRKTSEIALRSSQSLLARTGSVAGVGGWEIDLASGHQFWTDETFSILGLNTDATPTSFAALEYFDPADRDTMQAAQEAAIAGKGGFDQEVRIWRRDGTVIWVRVVGSVEFQQNTAVRVVGAIQDVSAKVEQLQRIELLYGLAEEQRAELAVYRSRADAEDELAAFLLSRLWRMKEMDQAGIRYFWEPAEKFSGDVIAVAHSTGGDVYGLLADATGHGLAAAINIIPLTSAFYAMARKGFNLATITEHLNQLVKEFSLADRFVAVTLVRFKRREGELEVVNAGNPPTLMLDRDLKVIREFPSGSIPLGIRPRPDFRPCIETVQLSGSESVLMFSDGLTEAHNLAGKPFGTTGLTAALAGAPSGAGAVDAIRGALMDHSTGVKQADDISVLLLSATEYQHRSQTESTQESADAVDAVLPAIDAPPPTEPEWEAALKFSSAELKHVEAVPVLVDLTRTLGLEKTIESRLFTVLSELFQNAIEHGLLRLDSQLKFGPEGFERFVELRQERLAALQQGSIRVHISMWKAAASPGRLQVEVIDSGPGFNFQEHLEQLADSQALGARRTLHGRGIGLLMKLCDGLEYRGRGNHAVATVEFS